MRVHLEAGVPPASASLDEPRLGQVPTRGTSIGRSFDLLGGQGGAS